MRWRARQLALACSCAALLSSARDARAQGANDAAAAEALFDEGKRLMTAKQFATACPKFAESQRLDPGIGTLLWLADCYAKNGQVASAWAIFKEAEALAAKHHDSRSIVAREEASRLEPKLSKLVIEVPPSSDVDGLEVRRDGAVLGRPLWGTPIPTDAGVHKITASAPQKKAWDGQVTVPRDGASVAIKIPTLESVPLPPPPVVAPPPVEAPAPPLADSTTGNTQRVVGIVLMGAGVVGAGVGTFFGLRVKSKNDESKTHCIDDRCDRTGFDARKDALSAATVSNIAFIAAGAALAGGLIVYLTAPRAPAQVSIGAGPLYGGAGATVQGVFH